ncbi:hypothetical protein D5S18_31350 [Nocardia panacis]|uniref:Uncharacterized protein n=1 Tax=Nocardia panacis TaxID=2340916 RepID=A0A3A4K9M8_9NOCA|nr:DUF6529 family protein [Nocardia panacis]RJO69162.1 hypothetical protein D5S18_31350 [Nocardia panacis]
MAEQRDGVGTAVALGAVLVGAAVAVGLGVFGKVHEPRYFALDIAGFSGGVAVKTWLACVVFVLVLGQLVSGLVRYGRIPGVAAPSWIGPLHVWTGRVAVLVSAPVAVHCGYSLGFQSYEPRVLTHSVFGCFFYGVFVAKTLLLTRRGPASWVIPVAGGLMFASCTGIWLTSALWFFEHNGLTF